MAFSAPSRTRLVAPRMLPVLILICCAVLSACQEPAEEEQEVETSSEAPVEARPLAEIEQPVEVSAAATVLAPNDSVLSAEISARVMAVHADAGAAVEAGQLLLQLDDADYRLALAQSRAQVAAAEARVQLAQQRLERGQRLNVDKYISDDELLLLSTEVDSAAADFRIAVAGRDVAARNVGKARIEAPFDGVIAERMAQVGSSVSPGTPLLRLVDLGSFEVEARIPAEDAAGLPQASSISFDSQGREYPLRLLRLSPLVDAAARSQLARFGFIDQTAPAGSSGSLRFVTPGARLPPDLQVRRDEQRGLFVVENGVARFVPVPGAQPGRSFKVDLPAQSLIIVRGQQGLQEGDPVELQGEAEAAAAAPALATDD